MLTPIQTDAQLEATKERVQELMHKSLPPGSAAAEELEALNELIDIYERMGPVVFMRAHETRWVNEIYLDFGQDVSDISVAFD